MGETDREQQRAARDPGGPGARRPASRRAVTGGAAVGVLALAVVVIVALVGARGGATTAGRRSPSPVGLRAAGTNATPPTTSPPTSSSVTTVPPVDVDAPPPAPDAAAPGQLVATGEDQSDPFLYLDGGHYYLYTSGVPGPPAVNVPVSSATSFGAWSPVADAMPQVPAWVGAGFTWAPDVHRFGSRYVLYFTAYVRNTQPAMECIGDAVGPSPTGPFQAFPEPFICQTTLGGDIDPRVFVAPDGGLSMLWKSDQNIGGANTPTQMWSQPLSSDGLRLTGQPSLLLVPDQPWEGTIVEAPDMVYAHGAYWMIYSGNWFNSVDYAVGAARCASPQGPCADLPGNPLLASNAQGQGPGEASLFADSAGIWLLYSPWRSLAPQPDVPPRPVYITRLGVGQNGLYLAAGGPPPPLDPPAAPRPARGGRSAP